jgi:hypothetical protein
MYVCSHNALDRALRLWWQVALQLFGYKKGELDGKNVSLLMPPPYSHRHSLYLRNCVAQGRSHLQRFGWQAFAGALMGRQCTPQPCCCLT